MVLDETLCKAYREALEERITNVEANIVAAFKQASVVTGIRFKGQKEALHSALKAVEQDFNEGRQRFRKIEEEALKSYKSNSEQLYDAFVQLKVLNNELENIRKDVESNKLFIKDLDLVDNRLITIETVVKSLDQILNSKLEASLDRFEKVFNNKLITLETKDIQRINKKINRLLVLNFCFIFSLIVYIINGGDLDKTIGFIVSFIKWW